LPNSETSSDPVTITLRITPSYLPQQDPFSPVYNQGYFPKEVIYKVIYPPSLRRFVYTYIHTYIYIYIYAKQVSNLLIPLF